MVEEEQRLHANISSNEGYQNSTALQIRLNTEPIITRLEKYLTGEVQWVTEVNGKVSTESVKTGEAKANKIGVQSILSTVSNIINPQTVQGNFDGENVTYGEYLKRQRKAFARDLMDNLHKYGIDESDYAGIINNVFAVIEPFMSRLINNLERESYDKTIRHTESQTNRVKNNMWPFGGNN